MKTYTVKKNRKILGSKLSLENAAEIAIDAGDHCSIIDDLSNQVAVEDTDGDYRTIHALECMLREYEARGPAPEPEPVLETPRPRFISAAKPPRRRKQHGNR